MDTCPRLPLCYCCSRAIKSEVVHRTARATNHKPSHSHVNPSCMRASRENIHRTGCIVLWVSLVARGEHTRPSYSIMTASQPVPIRSCLASGFANRGSSARFCMNGGNVECIHYMGPGGGGRSYQCVRSQKDHYDLCVRRVCWTRGKGRTRCSYKAVCLINCHCLTSTDTNRKSALRPEDGRTIRHKQTREISWREILNREMLTSTARGNGRNGAPLEAAGRSTKKLDVTESEPRELAGSAKQKTPSRLRPLRWLERAGSRSFCCAGHREVKDASSAAGRFLWPSRYLTRHAESTRGAGRRPTDVCNIATLDTFLQA